MKCCSLPRNLSPALLRLLAAPAVFVLSVSMLAPFAAALENDVVPEGARVEKLAGDFQFVEGPAYGPDGLLLFSDIPANSIIRYVGDGKTEVFLRPSGQSNGLAFDATGNLWACQHELRRVVRIDPEHRETQHIVADRYDGKKLNSPNDLALDGYGGLYFTDPRYGGGEPLEQPVKGVYWVSPKGEVKRVIDTLKLPNGILVSPDRKTLYVAENGTREIFAWPIVEPGRLGERKRLYEADQSLDGGGCDGMAIDREGNVYATYAKGITVITPDGKLVARIPVPEHPANCGFGGKDGKTLYITARTGFYAIELKIPGVALRERGPEADIHEDADAKAGAEFGGEGLREKKFRDLVLRVPAGWKESEASSTFRLGQFELDAAKDDAEGGEVVVFWFQGGVGGLDANLKRWIGQFDAGGRSGTIRRGTSEGGQEYTMIDLSGTYRQSFGPPVRGQTRPRPDWRVANVWIDDPAGAYVLRISGPKSTVEKEMKSFRRAFGAAPAEREKETSIEDVK